MHNELCLVKLYVVSFNFLNRLASTILLDRHWLGVKCDDVFNAVLLLWHDATVTSCRKSLILIGVNQGGQFEVNEERGFKILPTGGLRVEF